MTDAARPGVPARRRGLVKGLAMEGLRSVRAIGGHDVLIIVALATMAVARLKLIPNAFQADTWLALVDARSILHSGLPQHALFTTMMHGRTFVDQQWLAQLAIYGVQRLGGLALVAVAAVALQIGSLGGAALAARRLGANARAVVLVLVPAWWFTFVLLQVRAEVLVLPLFVALVYLLAADSRRPTYRVYACLALLVLWANLHGSAILGAGLVCLRGLTLAWECRRDLTKTNRWVRPAVLILGAPMCVLATPYGVGTISYYHDTLLNPSLRRFITEWAPITHVPLIAVPLLALLAAAVWSFHRRPQATTLWEKCALVVLAVSAASAQRNAIWFGLAVLMLLPVSINADLRSRRTHQRRPLLDLALLGAAIVAVVSAAFTTFAKSDGGFQKGYPPGVLAAVQRAIASDQSVSVFADGNIADWLLWHDPKIEDRLAYNDQLELLTESQFDQIRRLDYVLGVDWKRVARGHGLLVLNHEFLGSVLAFEREPGRQIIYRDSNYTVIRRDSKVAR